jgi:hypothetical protein
LQSYKQNTFYPAGRNRRDRLELKNVGDRIFVKRASGKIADGVILSIIPVASTGATYAQIYDYHTSKKFIVNLAHEIKS